MLLMVRPEENHQFAQRPFSTRFDKRYVNHAYSKLVLCADVIMIPAVRTFSQVLLIYEAL